MMRTQRGRHAGWTAVLVAILVLVTAQTAWADPPAARKLTVQPRSGPVGETVTLRGVGCRAGKGQRRTYLSGDVFHRHRRQPFGVVRVGWVRARRFAVHYLIPTRARDIQGTGGGRIRPGDRIRFRTHPQVCVSRWFFVEDG
jgi:hypothetical protein